jgi:separase
VSCPLALEVVLTWLASTSAITLQRELLEAIDSKFLDVDMDDLQWPTLKGDKQAATLKSVSTKPKAETPRPTNGRTTPSDTSDDEEDEEQAGLKAYWADVRSKHAANTFVDGYTYDLNALPSEWAVISINVTEDRNTMFVSRHQKGSEPLVFCLPLDRQGRREGEDDMFTYEAAMAELMEIIDTSNRMARGAKHVTTTEGRVAWWADRKALDKRMEELLTNVEFCWLGAFKVGLCSELM